MRSQYERMLAGELYIANDPKLGQIYRKCQNLLHEYNHIYFDKYERKKEICKNLLGSMGENVIIMPPFRCDYGENIHIGHNFFANYDCLFLDVAEIRIGDNVMLAPRVGIYTAGHPIDADIRNTKLEFGTPITIGNNVWIGANAVINPGVNIGNNVVIGSGSVVTKDIPDDVIAVGNPCKVLRKIDGKEKAKWEALKREYEEEYKMSFAGQESL